MEINYFERHTYQATVLRVAREILRASLDYLLAKLSVSSELFRYLVTDFECSLAPETFRSIPQKLIPEETLDHRKMANISMKSHCNRHTWKRKRKKKKKETKHSRTAESLFSTKISILHVRNFPFVPRVHRFNRFLSRPTTSRFDELDRDRFASDRFPETG